MRADFHIPRESAATAMALRSVIPQYETLADKYRRTWGLSVMLVDMLGHIVASEAPCPAERTDEHECIFFRRRAVREALRWGEPSMLLCPRGFVIWAVPVMQNSAALGGLVVGRIVVGAENQLQDSMSPENARRAAFDLLSMAEEANLTNAALLNLQRMKALRESERAEAIHELKARSYQSIRDIYLVEEPSLITAIKRGDRSAAREILNRVLTGIYFYGRERPSLLKSFVLELVVTMSRSAVEAGADPSELLGTNYSSFSELARIESEEDLCAWLVSMLERMMDAIKANQQYPSTVLLGEALRYMEEHLHEDLSRDDVAGVACLSPSHFSRVVKQTFGRSFTDMLAGMRIDRARELLARTEKSLIQVCLDCGFSDQSYFTKVFQKYTGQTPGEYRRTHRAIVQ